MRKLNVAVLISGRGSNMQALVESCRPSNSCAKIKCVISNKPGAAGLTTAARSGVQTHVIDQTKFLDRAAFELELTRLLLSSDIDLICLAGFMSLLSSDFVNRWNNKIINIHPSLLPSFKGLNTHTRVLAAGARVSGCTVHFVREKMDEGPIILQAATAVHFDDTAETLAERVLTLEHRCYPLALQWIAEGRIHIFEERVTVDNAPSKDTWFINPAP